jgi:hypothetical protein
VYNLRARTNLEQPALHRLRVLVPPHQQLALLLSFACEFSNNASQVSLDDGFLFIYLHVYGLVGMCVSSFFSIFNRICDVMHRYVAF